MSFNNFPFQVSWRLYRHGGDAKRVSRPAIRIATLGVALGVAIMIISISVVLGFKREVQQKVIGMNGHIEILNNQVSSEYESLPVYLPDSIMNQIRKIKGVSHVQRFCNKLGMLKTDNNFEGVMLHGIGSDYDSSFLKTQIVDGELTAFSDTSSSNRIVIGRTLANRMNLKVGDEVYSYFFDGNLRARKFKVSAIYATCMQEFDKVMAFTDIYATRKIRNLGEDEYTGAEIILDNFEELALVDKRISKLTARLYEQNSCPYVAATIKQIYPTIFSWLSLLDTNVWVILALMTAVAVFTMISGLMIIILERTQFIGTMKALGATNGQLRHIFLYFAGYIIIKGIALGAFLGIGFVTLQYYTGLVRLDSETYYVDAVPVEFHWPFFLLINVATIVISIMVLLIPSYLVSHIPPSKSIRFE